MYLKSETNQGSIDNGSMYPEKLVCLLFGNLI